MPSDIWKICHREGVAHKLRDESTPVGDAIACVPVFNECLDAFVVWLYTPVDKGNEHHSSGLEASIVFRRSTYRGNNLSMIFAQMLWPLRSSSLQRPFRTSSFASKKIRDLSRCSVVSSPS